MNIFYPEINIKHEVEKLMKNADTAYDQNMQEKRLRLKALLEAEEAQQEIEVMEKLREQQGERLKQKEYALLALKQDKQRQKEEFIKNKMIQLKINNCDEIRTHIQQKHLEESKRSQLAQIDDKNKLKQTQSDEDRMWKEILLRKYQQELARDLSEQRKRRLMEEKILLDLKGQIKDRSLKAEQEKSELKEAYCTSLCFPERDHKLIQIKKDDLADILKNQVSTKELLRKKRDEQERGVDDILNEAMQRELDRENTTRSRERDVLKKQINQYYQFSKHLQKLQQEEESKADKLINEVRLKYEKKDIEECRKALQKRLGFAEQVFESQRHQMAVLEDKKRQIREEELQQGIREREIYEQHKKANMEANLRSRLEAVKYRDSLNEQIKSTQLDEERRKDADRMQTNQLIACSAKDLDFVQSYVKGSFGSHFKKHPNLSLMRK